MLNVTEISPRLTLPVSDCCSSRKSLRAEVIKHSEVPFGALGKETAFLMTKASRTGERIRTPTT
jgi:hypothetical protein